MSIAKVAISMDDTVLDRVDRLVRKRAFPSRSRLIQEAVQEKLARLDRSRLARECAKLDPKAEKAMAEEWLAGEAGGMARVLRGDVFWAELDPVRGSEQAGTRPVLVLSHEVFNQRSGTVIAMALTSQPQRVGLPLALELTGTKMPKPTWVKIGQIRTLATERLGRRIASVTPEELDQIVEGLNEIVGG